MKRIVSLFVGLSLLAVAGITQAGMITDTVSQNAFVGWWKSYSYTHDLNDNGFVPGSAVGGSLAVQVSDDGGRFDLGETILFTVEAFDFDTGGISWGSGFLGDLEVKALGALNADGLLDITVTSLWGDFYVGNSVLTVITQDAQSVPTPSVLLLMSLGLLGMGAVRRKA
jgi:hypothetical protein